MRISGEKTFKHIMLYLVTQPDIRVMAIQKLF